MLIEDTKELAQNKLLLLYLISKSDYVLSNKDITEFLLENDYMNYFLVQQYLSELSDSNLIHVSQENPDRIYEITEQGNTTLLYFQDRVPEGFKLDVEDKFIKTVEDKKKDQEVLAEFYQKESGQFVVNLKLVEQKDTLFSIYVDVPDLEQAEIISEHWKKNTDYIYVNILNTLTDNSLK